MSRTIQPPTMHTKLVAASVSDMVQEWYQGKCEVPPMQADTFEQRISRFQSDLSQAAVAAALEAAAAHCKQVAEDCKKYNLPQAAGMVASVGREIRALITQPQHDALQAAIDAARKVKPLDWSDAEYPNECWNAGDYDIWSEHGGFQVYHWSIKTGDLHHDLKAAQDAAFTHHETRVQSFLAQIGAKP